MNTHPPAHRSRIFANAYIYIYKPVFSVTHLFDLPTMSGPVRGQVLHTWTILDPTSGMTMCSRSTLFYVEDLGRVETGCCFWEKTWWKPPLHRSKASIAPTHGSSRECCFVRSAKHDKHHKRQHHNNLPILERMPKNEHFGADRIYCIPGLPNPSARATRHE